MDAHRKILIADDTAMFRELGSLFLARFGAVTTATGGREALEIALRDHPDVIVADLRMPDMDGDVLCHAIRRNEQIQDTPVILVIPGEDPEDRARAVRAGADDVVAKPISRIALVDAVNRFLRSSRRSGLARVDVETPVCIRDRGALAWGRSVNLSRGGIFVAADKRIPIATEVELEFLLPETEAPLHSTARVVWERDDGSGTPAGMGLQFLALDRESTRQIEGFVYERADDASRPPTPLPDRMT
ncbi:MAG: TIGR02266 family protein [Myxococcota bacterium]